MKKILTLIILVLLAIMAFMYNEGKNADKLIRYQEQKINSLEHDIVDLNSLHEDKEDVSGEGIVDDEENLMTVSYPVALGNDYPYSFELIQVEVPQNSAVLTASYQALFDGPVSVQLADGSFGNSAVPNSNLAFSSVSIDEGTANIYLDGQYYGMHMGDIVFREQINRTAFQFPTVNEVQVFVNNQLFDWCITDVSGGEGPCGNGPQYWVDQK